MALSVKVLGPLGLCYFDPLRDPPGLPFLCAQRSLTHHARGAFEEAEKPCPCLGEMKTVLY